MPPFFFLSEFLVCVLFLCFVLFFVVVIALTDLEIDHAYDIPQYFCAKYSCYNWKQLRVVKEN